MERDLETMDAVAVAAAEKTLSVPVVGLSSFGRAHRKRLRFLFGFGRPVHLGTLTGVDLDLLAGGLVRHALKNRTSGGACLEVTEDGQRVLHELRQQGVKALAVHNTLGSRLAKWLRSKGKLTWENVGFVHSWRHTLAVDTWSEVRADVFACAPTLRAASAKPEIFEIKVSRADFRADLAKPNKRAGYLDLSEAAYYVCPKGVIDAQDVPAPFGLYWETDPGVFVMKKRAKRKKAFVLHQDALMTLILRRRSGVDEEWESGTEVVA